MNETYLTSSAIQKIAWGYVFLHLDFSLGPLNIFPDWVGYLLFWLAIPILSTQAASARLLKPLTVALGAWQLLRWVLTLFGVSWSSILLSTIAAVLNLYFHFQLLTNLASIAHLHNCSEENRILRLRTTQTILSTVLFLPFPWLEWDWLLIPIMLLHLIVTIWICSVLFSLRRSFMLPEAEGS